MSDRLLTKRDYLFILSLLVVSCLIFATWYLFSTLSNGKTTRTESLHSTVQDISNRVDLLTNKVNRLDTEFTKKFNVLDSRLLVIESRLRRND